MSSDAIKGVQVGDVVTTVFDGEVIAIDNELGKITLRGNTRGAQHVDWYVDMHWATEFYEGNPPVGTSDCDLEKYLQEERDQLLARAQEAAQCWEGMHATRIADLESLLAEAKGEVVRLQEENVDTMRHFNNAKAEVRRLLRNGTTVQISLHGADADSVAKAVVQAKAEANKRSSDSPCPPGFVCAEHGRVGR